MRLAPFFGAAFFATGFAAILTIFRAGGFTALTTFFAGRARHFPGNHRRGFRAGAVGSTGLPGFAATADSASRHDCRPPRGHCWLRGDGPSRPSQLWLARAERFTSVLLAPAALADRPAAGRPGRSGTPTRSDEIADLMEREDLGERDVVVRGQTAGDVDRAHRHVEVKRRLQPGVVRPLAMASSG